MTTEKTSGTKTIARNKKAFHEYEVLERLECGIVLTGTEVKSLREGRINFGQAHARVVDNELILFGLNIAEYHHGNYMNHLPEQRRTLLAHKREIRKLRARVEEKGLTLVPLALYWKEGRCKVELGIVRGKMLHSKRETKRNRDMDRRIEREARIGRH